MRNFYFKTTALLIAAFFSVNALKAQTHVTGGIFSNTTWTVANSPYIVTDTIKVFPGVTLTIQPGVVVKFDTMGIIQNFGTFIANGTQADSIVFTSSSVTPGPSSWNEINNGTSFKYCRISYSTWGINLSDTTVKHCLFDSNYYGMWGTNFGVDSSVFKYNYTGLRTGHTARGCDFIQNYIGDNASERMVNCNFIGNTYGSYFSWGSIVNCTFNYDTTAIYDPQDSILNSTFQYNSLGIWLSNAYVIGNSFTNNGIAIQTGGFTTNEIMSNNISYNQTGIETNGDVFSCNTISHNSKYNLVMEAGANTDAKNNYFDLPDSASIQATIYCAYQNFHLGFAYFTPFDTVPCSYFCTNNFNQDICIVTTDTAINKNVIVWGRGNLPPNNATSFVNIYDSTALGWVKIATVADTALSEYVDAASNPSARAYSYKISTVDSCGESSLSPTNTSIYLQVALLAGRDSLYWTPYVGFGTTKYYIYRGLALNALTLLDSVSGSTLNYVDLLPPAGSIYLIEAVNPGGPCVPSHSMHRFLVNTNASISNGGVPKAPLSVNGITASGTSVQVYPNPSNGHFTIQASSQELMATGSVEVYNVMGEKIYTHSLNINNSKSDINLSSEPNGVYLIRVLTEGGNLASDGKFVIEK